MARFRFVLTALFLAPAAAVAQPAFEVASVKLLPPVELAQLRPGAVTVEGNRATFLQVSMTALVMRAYGVKPFQISGPGWIGTTQYDVTARLPPGATAEQVPQMLQALLAERFHLTVRRESKQFPVYALVIGKSRPKPAPAGSGMTLQSYVGTVSMAVDRPVVDMTGLEGKYLFDQKELLEAAMRDGGARMMHVDPAPGPSTFEVVQSHGLKLEPRRLMLPFLVIENVEKTPTED